MISSISGFRITPDFRISCSSIKFITSRSSILALRSSMLHLGHRLGPQALQEPARLGAIELRVVGLDTQEEAIARGMRGELRHVEDRMVRFRQAVQRQHPKYRRQRRD